MDIANAHLEAHTEKRRAITDGEVDLIKAAAQYGIEHLGADPAQAERAFQKHFRKVVREQDNSDGVLKEALEDLSTNPPDDASAANDSQLTEEFLGRLESYSAAASTDELRKRWGRVLAAEVRKPGTFSGKVLRVVDELDSVTALQFEEIAKHRIGRVLPKALVGKLAYNIRTNLVLAELLIEPGISGQVRYYMDAKDSVGLDLKMAGFPGVGAVAFSSSATVSTGSGDEDALTFDDSKPGIPCYLLTEVGEALASILADQQFSALSHYAHKAAESEQLEWVRLFVHRGDSFQLVSQIPGKKVPEAPA